MVELILGLESGDGNCGGSVHFYESEAFYDGLILEDCPALAVGFTGMGNQEVEVCRPKESAVSAGAKETASIRHKFGAQAEYTSDIALAGEGNGGNAAAYAAIGVDGLVAAAWPSFGRPVDIKAAMRVAQK